MEYIEKNIGLKKEFNELIRQLGNDITRQHVVPELQEERKKYEILMANQLSEVERRLHDKNSKSLELFNDKIETLLAEIQSYLDSIQKLKNISQEFETASSNFLYQSDIAKRSHELVDTIGQMKKTLQDYESTSKRFSSNIEQQQQRNSALVNEVQASLKSVYTVYTSLQELVTSQFVLMNKVQKDHYEKIIMQHIQGRDQSVKLNCLIQDTLRSIIDDNKQWYSMSDKEFISIDKQVKACISLVHENQALIRTNEIWQTEHMTNAFEDLAITIVNRDKKTVKMIVLSFVFGSLISIALASGLFILLR